MSEEIFRREPRAWAEIDLGALRENLGVVRRRGGLAVMACVKADAYGHGLVEVARALDGEGLAFFGVANAGEARVLWEAGVETPLYLLGATLPGERKEIAARGWTPCLCSLEEMEDFDRLGRERGKVRAHLALDTGMGRGGFLPGNLGAALEKLRGCAGIELRGVGSHLPVADEDAEFTRAQFELFDGLVEKVYSAGYGREGFQVHLANSAGILGYRSRTANLVRPGLMLYGISPFEYEGECRPVAEAESLCYGSAQAELKPVMTLKTRVSLVNLLPAGHGVSYGRIVLEKETRTAVLGIGYGDGYPRSLSGTGAGAMIGGVFCPLLGRVTMDQVIVDASEVPGLNSGAEAVLFGKTPLVSEVAKNAGTIPWEILTGIMPRVERRYL